MQPRKRWTSTSQAAIIITHFEVLITGMTFLVLISNVCFYAGSGSVGGTNVERIQNTFHRSKHRNGPICLNINPNS